MPTRLDPKTFQDRYTIPPGASDSLFTYKQWVMMETYLSNGFHLDSAVRKAGYTTLIHGHVQFRKKHVQFALRKRLEASAMPADEALARLARLARATIADSFKIDEDSDRLIFSPDKAFETGGIHAIKAVRRNKFGVNVEMVDPLVALTSILRAHGLLDRVQAIDPANVTDDEVIAYAKRIEAERASRLADGSGGAGEEDDDIDVGTATWAADDGDGEPS